jgi:hypothetical protein
MCLITWKLIILRVTPHQFSIIIEVSSPYIQKCVTVNSDDQRTLQNCRFSVSSAVHVTIQTPNTKRCTIKFLKFFLILQTQDAPSDPHSCSNFGGNR